VFLMDEPLSSLDAGLRVQTRGEILALQKRLGITTVYVTHDQVEAMSMGDRVAVMRNGGLQQCAAPQQLYDLPANVYVAAFVGTPPMNLFHTELLTDREGDRWVRFSEGYLALDRQSVRAHPGLRGRADGPIIVGVRPEALSIAPHDETYNVIDVTVTAVEMLGSESLAYVTAPVDVVHALEPGSGLNRLGRNESAGFGAHGFAEADHQQSPVVQDRAMCARLTPAIRLPRGAPLRLAVDNRRLFFFDTDGTLI
jgi:multiple sugar transport system ATP-binding protein